MQIFTKPVEQIDFDDIQALIENSVSENERIEFKRSLPSNVDAPDSWYEDKNQISKYARKKILEESVAFANAFGGALIWGIEENEAKPPAAARISPIPKCADLADRLKLIFRDCVEPELPQIEIFAVQSNDGESGVVILRTGRSFRAPHRVKPTGVCPIRRSDRCEKMSMREIQDLTLNMNRGLEGLNRTLLNRSTRFREEKFQRLVSASDAFGLRMTAAPVLDEVKLGSVYLHGNIIEELSPPIFKIQRTIGDQTGTLADLLSHFNLAPSSWRPMLRATSAEAHNPSNISTDCNCYAYHEISNDGILETGFLSINNFIDPHFQTEVPITLKDEIPVSMFAQLIEWADRIRNVAGATTAEYAIEIEITAMSDRSKVEFGNRYSHIPPARIPLGTNVFPHYPLVESNQQVNLVALFEKDFWNFHGKDLGNAQGCLSFNFNR